MKTIEEKNRMIAEFMGYEIMYRPFGEEFIEISDTELCDLNDLKYHTSWDWLMPVVEKIEEIALEEVKGSYKVHRFSIKIESFYCVIIDSKDNNRELIIADSGDKKNNVYWAVVNFIEFYNESK